MIRIRVPLVRPLVRCTFKRILRILPSILLLLFVFSLIFVTLMQIAVIHSHRRNHYVAGHHEPFNVTSLPTPGHTVLGIPNLQLVTKPVPHKRPDTLRVEAFLDKTAPTVEANVAIVQNMVNCAKVRRILNLLGSKTRGLRTGSRVHIMPSRTKHSISVHLNMDYNRQYKKPACPAIPPLEGRVRPDLSPHNLSLVVPSPLPCVARHKVAIVIPYRDREEHLVTLLNTLHPLLQRQQIQYRVYVVEQFGNDTFNKGVLMNAGVRESLRDLDFGCFVFHDVDLIPEDDRNMYSCPHMPRHMSVAVDKFNYTLPYSLLVGGVFSIRLDHFLAVNGYSNLYWGWGGEDDDMAYRIKYRKLEIIRPPETIARYSMIKHEHRPESPSAIRTALLRMAKKRSSRDGLNTVKYRVVWRHDSPSHTHLMIDIGRNHRWHFMDSQQRLIINF